MNYQECLNYINKLYIGKTKEPTLDRIKKILKAFDYDYKINVIHVAGTNGKGSTCCMMSKIIENAGYKVGLYTSPHLVDINERIKINDENISNDDFSKYVTKIVEKMDKCNIELLFFEVLTVVALLYFEDKKCDIVILETGLGGEYDATNVIDKPLCTVITNIGLEHEDVLGKGIVNIAKAKAGIMKENVDCVLYDIQDGKEIFEEIAKEKNARIHKVDFKNLLIFDNKNNFHNLSHDNMNLSNQNTNMVEFKNIATFSKFCSSDDNINNDTDANKNISKKNNDNCVECDNAGIGSNFENKSIIVKQCENVCDKNIFSNYCVDIVDKNIKNNLHNNSSNDRTDSNCLTHNCDKDNFCNNSIDNNIENCDNCCADSARMCNYSNLNNHNIDNNIANRDNSNFNNFCNNSINDNFGNINHFNIFNSKSGICSNYCKKNIFMNNNNLCIINNLYNYKNYKNLRTSLIGEHQIKNSCVAIEAIEIIKNKGYLINEDNIRNGLLNVHWPARFQILSNNENEPIVILDGGHNPQCIDAIINELKNYNNKNIVFVVSIVKDKNVDLMAKKLSALSKKIVLTHIDNKRGMEEEELKNIFLQYSDEVTYIYDILDSINYAKNIATKNGIVCIIGSLYFAGDLLKIYKKNI